MNIKIAAAIILATLLQSGLTQAAPHIAVLPFELNDMTALPNTVEEQRRTASIQPLLEAAITQTGAYQITHISPQNQAEANASFGYLFRFHDLAAKLGGQVEADWVIVGQHSKPSFLYSYLNAQVINVKTKTLVARIDVELKGNHESVTQHGVRALAKKIHAVIKQ